MNYLRGVIIPVAKTGEIADDFKAMLQNPEWGPLREVMMTQTPKVPDLASDRGDFYHDPEKNERIPFKEAKFTPWDFSKQDENSFTEASGEAITELSKVQLWQMSEIEKAILRGAVRRFMNESSSPSRLRAYQWLKEFVASRNSINRTLFYRSVKAEPADVSYRFSDMVSSFRLFNNERSPAPGMTTWLRMLQALTESLGDASLDAVERKHMVRQSYMLYRDLANDIPKSYHKALTRIQNSKIQRYLLLYQGKLPGQFAESVDLFQNPRRYEELIQQVRMRDFWIPGMLFYDMLKQTEKTILEYPERMRTLEKLILSEDPLLSAETFLHLSNYWAGLERKDSRASRKVGNYIKELLFKIIRPYGFDFENYGPYLLSLEEPGPRRFYREISEKMFREGLAEGNILKIRYEKGIHLLMQFAARNELSEKELAALLEIDPYDPAKKTFFDRILDEGDNRKRYEEIVKVAPPRNEIRKLQSDELTQSYFLKEAVDTPSLLTHLLAGVQPPRAEIRRLVSDVKHFGVASVARSFKRQILHLFRDAQALAAQETNVAIIQASGRLAMKQKIERLGRRLSRHGIRFDDAKAADLVFTGDELPQEELLNSILKLEPRLHLLLIHLPRGGFEAMSESQWNHASQMANGLEDHVNQFLNETEKSQTERLSVYAPKSAKEAKEILQNAARIFYSQRKGDGTAPSVHAIQERLTYIYPETIPHPGLDRGIFSLGTEIRHGLKAGDDNHFGKYFLLLKGASEISEETISSLGRLFDPVASRRYQFKDDLISTELLLEIARAQVEMERYVASSA